VRTRQAFPGAVDHVKIPAAHQAGVARKSLPPGGAIRAIRERGDDVPSCGAPRALYGHLQSSYANGIRVSWRGVVSAVEMYASAKHSPLLVFTVPELPKLQELVCSGDYWLGWLGVFSFEPS